MLVILPTPNPFLFCRKVKGEVPNLQAQVDKCADCKRTGVDHQHASKRMKADTDSPAAAAAEEPSQWDYSYCTHLAPVGAHRLVDSAAMAQWLGQHFVGLLVYYSLGESVWRSKCGLTISRASPSPDFSADKHAVSIRTGGPLPLKHAHRGMWTKSGVVVEDPFELSHNIASKVSENAWQ